jgi:hypothetical protein
MAEDCIFTPLAIVAFRGPCPPGCPTDSRASSRPRAAAWIAVVVRRLVSGLESESYGADSDRQLVVHVSEKWMPLMLIRVFELWWSSDATIP